MIKKFNEYEKVNEEIGFPPINIDISYEDDFGIKSPNLIENIADMIKNTLSGKGWNGLIKINHEGKTIEIRD